MEVKAFWFSEEVLEVKDDVKRRNTQREKQKCQKGFRWNDGGMKLLRLSIFSSSYLEAYDEVILKHSNQVSGNYHLKTFSERITSSYFLFLLLLFCSSFFPFKIAQVYVAEFAFRSKETVEQ